MKHNKKRNTAFLYECLIRELTKAIVREQKEKQEEIKDILRNFFSKGKPLKQELELYFSLLETKKVDKDFSTRLMTEVKKDFDELDRQTVFNEQTKLINTINKALGQKTFGNFVPNYKDLATIGMFFQDSKLPAKSRIILEQKLVNFLTGSEDIREEMKPVDSLEFKMFVKRFNETYDNSLLQEQKELLSNYITSFSDNGLGLKYYLNKEIGRLKESVVLEINKADSISFRGKMEQVLNKLEEYSRKPLNNDIVEEVFFIQNLLAEVKKSGN
jgi:hypothetical protein